jgi:uncharacterized protein YjiS (DUF1127 family)
MSWRAEEMDMEQHAMNFRQKYREWVVYRDTVDKLTRCSDRSLADLGISREDIRAVARRHARAN